MATALEQVKVHSVGPEASVIQIVLKLVAQLEMVRVDTTSIIASMAHHLSRRGRVVVHDHEHKAVDALLPPRKP